MEPRPAASRTPIHLFSLASSLRPATSSPAYLLGEPHPCAHLSHELYIFMLLCRFSGAEGGLSLYFAVNLKNILSV